jgi:ribulose-bisphosphate carboxylase large chain
MAGGGILAHPGGAAAGVRALHQAWQAAVDGLSIKEGAAKYPEFAASVEKFGSK